MAREETLRDVAPEIVGHVVQGYVDDGARDVRTAKNTNGKWDVTAHFDLEHNENLEHSYRRAESHEHNCCDPTDS